MQKSIFSFFIVLFLVQCTVTEKPEFIGVDQIQVKSADLENIVLMANASFTNGNDLGGTLATKNMNVYVDDIMVAEVNTEDFVVPAKSDFTVPLEVHIPTKKILNESKGGLLGILANHLAGKDIKVGFKGDIEYKLGRFSYSYPLDHTQEISLK